MTTESRRKPVVESSRGGGGCRRQLGDRNSAQIFNDCQCLENEHETCIKVFTNILSKSSPTSNATNGVAAANEMLDPGARFPGTSPMLPPLTGWLVAAELGWFVQTQLATWK